MENIVMRYFRAIYGYTLAETVQHLGIGGYEYLRLETGGKLLSKTQTEQLALLFNLNNKFCWNLPNSLTYLTGTLKAVPSHKAYTFINTNR